MIGSIQTYPRASPILSISRDQSDIKQPMNSNRHQLITNNNNIQNPNNTPSTKTIFPNLRMSDFESSFTKNNSSIKNNKPCSTTPSTRNGLNNNLPSPSAPTPSSLPQTSLQFTCDFLPPTLPSAKTTTNNPKNEPTIFNINQITQIPPNNNIQTSSLGFSRSLKHPSSSQQPQHCNNYLVSSGHKQSFSPSKAMAINQAYRTYTQGQQFNCAVRQLVLKPQQQYQNEKSNITADNSNIRQQNHTNYNSSKKRIDEQTNNTTTNRNKLREISSGLDKKDDSAIQLVYQQQEQQQTYTSMIEQIRNYHQPNKNYHYNIINKNNNNINSTALNKTSNEGRVDDSKVNNSNNISGSIQNIVLIARKIKSQSRQKTKQIESNSYYTDILKPRNGQNINNLDIIIPASIPTPSIYPSKITQSTNTNHMTSITSGQVQLILRNRQPSTTIASTGVVNGITNTATRAFSSSTALQEGQIEEYFPTTVLGDISDENKINSLNAIPVTDISSNSSFLANNQGAAQQQQWKFPSSSELLYSPLVFSTTTTTSRFGSPGGANTTKNNGRLLPHNITINPFSLTKNNPGNISSTKNTTSNNLLDNYYSLYNHQHPHNQRPAEYKYIVNYGNNCLIVMRVMSTRDNWKPIKSHDSAYNFKWCPYSSQVKFDRLGVGMRQLVNHLESHIQLTCKFTLVKNLKLYCDTLGFRIFNNIMPLTFLIDLDDDQAVTQLRQFSKFFLRHSPVKSQESSKKAINGFIKEIKPLLQYPNQNINGNTTNWMGSGNYQDGKNTNGQNNKNRMHESLTGSDTYFWFLKPTGTNRGRGIYIFNTLEQLKKHILDFDVGIEEMPLKKQTDKQDIKKNSEDENNKDNQNGEIRENSPGITEEQKELGMQQNILPLIGGKGQESSNIQNQCERDSAGIDKTTTTKNRDQYITGSPSKKRKAGKEPTTSGASTATTSTANPPASVIKCRQFVVQKYVERPLLIHGRKFDIRFWVIVTHSMDVYFFKESVIRTSGQQFNLDSSQINNQFIHLTNNAVQRYAENYGQFESGNQMSLANFFKYCKETYPTCDTSKMLEDMKNIVIHTMQSVKRKINPEDRKFTFELYGYDFLIDSAFNVWLLEVNTNPCLDESSPHLQQVLPRLLDDAFKLTLDVIFPRTKIIAKEYLQMGQQQQQQNGIANNKSGIIIPNSNTSKGNQDQQNSQVDKTEIGMTPGKKEDLNISIEESEEELKQVKQIGLSNSDTDKNENNSNGTAERVSEVIGSETTGGTTGEQDIVGESVTSNNNSSCKQKKSQSQWESSIKQNGQQNAKDNSETKKTKDNSKQPGTTPYILNSKKQTNWPVDGHPDDENMWELLCSISVPRTKPIPKRPTF